MINSLLNGMIGYLMCITIERIIWAVCLGVVYIRMKWVQKPANNTILVSRTDVDSCENSEDKAPVMWNNKMVEIVDAPCIETQSSTTK